MMPLNKTLDQQRAENALSQVQEVVKLTPEDRGHYRSYVQALPADIVMQGLGQALATQRAGYERDPGHKLLYEHVSQWLCREDFMAPYPPSSQTEGDILAAITKGDRIQYQKAHAEAMEYLAWLKKFAMAYLEKPEGGENS